MSLYFGETPAGEPVEVTPARAAAAFQLHMTLHKARGGMRLLETALEACEFLIQTDTLHLIDREAGDAAMQFATALCTIEDVEMQGRISGVLLHLCAAALCSTLLTPQQALNLGISHPRA